MTARAIGAASRPPVASRRRRRRPRRPPRRRPAGRSAGAKPMNQACGLRPLAVLRGAGLAGDPDAGDLRAVPVPASTTCGIISVSWPARLRADRGAAPRGSGAVEHGQVRRLHLAHEVGLHHHAAVGDRRPRPSPSAAGSPARRTGRSPTAPSAARWGPRGRRCATLRIGTSNGLVEAELLGLLAQRVVAELEAELAERGVAGDAQRLGQRRVAAAARPRRRSSAASRSVCGRSSAAPA